MRSVKIIDRAVLPGWTGGLITGCAGLPRASAMWGHIEGILTRHWLLPAPSSWLSELLKLWRADWLFTIWPNSRNFIIAAKWAEVPEKSIKFIPGSNVCSLSDSLRYFLFLRTEHNRLNEGEPSLQHLSSYFQQSWHHGPSIPSKSSPNLL